jgi:hypothetical protein
LISISIHLSTLSARRIALHLFIQQKNMAAKSRNPAFGTFTSKKIDLGIKTL